tara:strand:+ start:995 stop:1288 length:294 start_codon:yes stop_codon:yes gene_type:complete
MNTEVVSNLMGPGGTPIDRLYGSPASGGEMRIINKDFTEYKGKIHKRALSKKDIDGSRFRSYCYVTDDNRWFDRSGMPINKPNDLLKESSSEPKTEL